MRILLDGQLDPPHTAGDVVLVRDWHAHEDPTFDVDRLQYHPDDVKTDADARAVRFAAQKRHEIVGEPDALRRDGWTMKGVLAAMILMRSDPPTFDAIFIPAVTNAFAEEAARRGRGETAEELMQASAQKMLSMLFATNLVEGNLRGLQRLLEAASADDVEAILKAAIERAGEDMTLLQAQAQA